MKIDISGIIEAKLEQMEAEGTIRKKIEEALEKSVLSAVTSELDSYRFTQELRDEMKKAVAGVAEQSGLAAYNGFIVQAVRRIVQEVAADDLTAKVQAALDGALLKKYENVKLSDIFEKYHEWVCRNTDESDKYDRQHYTAELEWSESYGFTNYKVQLSEHPNATRSYSSDPDEIPDIEIRFSTWAEGRATRISTLYLDNRDLRTNLRIGTLNEFEAFVVNLYFNGTSITVDMEDADDYGYFDVDI